MNKFVLGLVLALLVTATSAYALDMTIQAEDITNKDGNNWGRKVSDITTSTSAYGGLLQYGDARMVWDITDETRHAMVKLPVKDLENNVNAITIRSLTGFARDDFDVYMQNPRTKGWVLLGSVSEDSNTEVWVDHYMELDDRYTKGNINEMKLKIVATGEKWSGFDTWGQLAIDWIKLHY